MFLLWKKKIQATLTEKDLGTSRSPWVAGTSKKFFSKFPASTPRLLTRESSPASQLSAWKIKCTSGTKLGRNQLQYFQTGQNLM